ncbi:ABC transporter permease subunit [Paraburkholderia silviterrae]|uniref:Polar amino acid ABC transporter permease n=1 Tax=Paraburkholderia silviterrae TaxID=2528715 RepID=A0A4R5M767_9BURK|nr:ABC transporter permease subunit [Paraburkholderia silviterrae]TDG21966.1 polar amino acid ABC transporter permease [Paraburkholderia silviterrae]
MSLAETLRTLAAWTPWLLGGFAWNIAISLTAQTIGTLVGYLLALSRTSQQVALARATTVVTELMRNTPTFVFQFYLVFMLPGKLTMPFDLPSVAFPSWLKAALALSLAVAGFTSDCLTDALSRHPGEQRQALARFLPVWSSYFVIIVMASSVASVIGVSELVSRCNTVINASGTTDMMLWVYLYAMAWFFVFCFCATRLIRAASKNAHRRR